MSLLIKALQKAEQGKATSARTEEADSGLTLELTPAERNSQLQDEAGFTDDYESVAETQQKHANQQAASSMFTAKAARADDSSKRIWILTGLGLLILAVLAGFYFYLQSLVQPELVMPRSTMPAPPVQNQSTNPIDPAALADSTMPAPEPAAAAQTTGQDAVRAAVAPAAAADEPVVYAGAEPAVPGAVTRNAGRSQQLSLGEPVATADSGAIKITRNVAADTLSPDLTTAYQAFMAGDDVTAQRFYRQVLQRDVRNVDALLGMAAIAARQGRNSDAMGWYGRVLEIEPRNSVAQLAMIGGLSQADPVAAESRIKNMLAQYPQSAQLHAALGNLYAEQKQWPAAQQAYFLAHRFDAKHAEYAFNLAVSLDHMGKSALALQYYQQALALLAGPDAGLINRSELESRITQLQTSP